jgi:hypothetical protein
MNPPSTSTRSSNTAPSSILPSSEARAKAYLLHDLVQQESSVQRELVVQEAELHAVGHDNESTRIAQADAIANCGAGVYMCVCVFVCACLCVSKRVYTMYILFCKSVRNCLKQNELAPRAINVCAV